MVSPIKGSCWERFLSCCCCKTEVENPTQTTITNQSTITQEIFDHTIGTTQRSRHTRLSSTELLTARTFIRHSGAAFDKYIAEKKAKQTPDGK